MWGAAPRHRRILILLGMCAAIVFGCVHGATAASRQATGAIDDFNGDGRSDFAFFRPSTDLWSVRNVGNVTWGASGDIPVPGDYNGDGKTDYAFFRPSTGVWSVRNIANITWGVSGDIPAPGDYNGDGKTDTAVFRPSTGVWYANGTGSATWGASGDIPVPGDYNGDSKTDFAFFRPSTGLWSVRSVGNVTWGASGDIPVPGDYNGDGKTDYAFFRPSTGVWSVRNIANITWGVSGDIPAPGDYNGDGKTDTAVFRPSTGVWYANGTGSATWGASGDMPIRDGVAEAAARGTPTPPPTDTTPPSPVSGFNVAGVTQTTISVGWVPASDNVGVTGYNVYRDGVKVGSPTTTSFTVTGLTCGTSHSLAVEAVDAAGNFSNRALSTITQTTSPCASDTTAPSAPTNLHTTGSTATSITVSWNASTDNVGVSGYGRYLNGSLASSGTGTTYTFGSLTCATSYDLAVDAYDAATNRSAKATIAASTAACPAGGDTTAPSIPTNFRVTGTTSSSITVAWNASTDNVGVTSYGLYNGAVLTGSATSTSATFNGLPCNSSQTLAVDASDAAGNRSGKATLSAATSACPTDTTAPSTPTNLRVTGATSSSITVAWNASTDNVGVTSYGLYKAGTLTGSTTTTSATFNGLPCNTTQALAVDAADAAGNRSGNATLTASTSACPDTTPPSTPTGLATTGSSQATISLSWNASTDNVGVTGYNIYRAGSLAGTSTTTSFTAGSLSCATGYGFSVQAKDAAGNVSTNSSSVNATTAACSAASHPPGGGWLIRSADDGASTYTGSLMDDPIVFPGRPGASHMHDFFCNAQTTGSSTYLQMVAAPTACPSGDAAGYWAPALYKNGVKINPSGSGVRGQIYYRASNITANVRMTAFPADFMMIVGDSHATSLTDANAVNADSGLGSKIGSEQYWGCSDNSESGKSSEPINCSTGIISLHLGFPNCWNGVKVNGDQIKAGTMRFPSSGACPTDFPILLPRLIERFEYPVGTDSSGITLSSGPTYTVHADFWNTWRQSSLEFLVDNCLNAAIDCGTNPSVP